MNLLSLRSHSGYSGANKITWIRIYASIFLGTNTIHKVSSNTVHSVFLSKFIFIYLFITITICNHQQSTFYNWKLHRTTLSFVNSILRVNFADNCLYLSYMICWIYCLSFFSVIATHLTLFFVFSNSNLIFVILQDTFHWSNWVLKLTLNCGIVSGNAQEYWHSVR